MDLALKDLPAPKLEGPADAEVTLIGWGSTEGVIREARQLNASGNRRKSTAIQVSPPFHSRGNFEILKHCKKLDWHRDEFTGQFARSAGGDRPQRQ